MFHCFTSFFTNIFAKKDLMSKIDTYISDLNKKMEKLNLDIHNKNYILTPRLLEQERKDYSKCKDILTDIKNGFSIKRLDYYLLFRMPFLKIHAAEINTYYKNSRARQFSKQHIYHLLLNKIYLLAVDKQ